MSAHAMKSMLLAALTLTVAAAPAQALAAESTSQSRKPESKQIERGRYLAKIAGCNDCHTPGYAVSGGKVPESQWLIGDKLGWRGPWGTTYAVNLRLYLRDMSEAQWVQRAKTMQSRPPMPWFVLRDMTDQDLKALYRYVKALGPGGEPAPLFVPPGKEPPGPYVLFPAAPK